ncbi:hypothetical protein DsansV1_C19g0160911 [Dioscorea sansibarensis]
MRGMQQTIPEHDESFPRATPDSETEVRTELITGDGQKEMANELSTALADKQVSEHHQSQLITNPIQTLHKAVILGENQMRRQEMIKGKGKKTRTNAKEAALGNNQISQDSLSQVVTIPIQTIHKDLPSKETQFRGPVLNTIVGKKNQGGMENKLYLMTN